MSGLAQDLPYVLRQLRKSPGFTIAGVLTLALAIGANAVVFSLLNELVLRPLNVPGGQNLYQIEGANGGAPSESYPDYVDLRDRNRSFDGLIAYEMSTAGLDSDGKTAPIWLYTASGNYFDVLGIQPYLGRFFHGSDEHGPNSAPYVVLSYDYWQSHFQGDRGVVGRAVRVNKYSYTILGVAPVGFRGTELFYAPALWAPLVNQQQIEGSSNLDARSNRGRWVVGRLRSGVTPAQAGADLNSIAAYLAKSYPKEDDGIAFGLARPGLAGDLLGGPVHAFVAGLMLLAGLILLAACANLGVLFAARAADRTREVALRLALGSSRGRILRQLLTEAVLVSIAGGALGMAGSVVLLRMLSAWRPDPIFPINLDIHPDLLTCAVALLLALASGFLFGMVPVRQVLKTDPFQGIKTGISGWTNSRRVTLRDLLLGAQIAVCAVLVTSSLVAVRGMIRSLHSNFGFLPQNVLQVNTDLDMAGYKGAQVAVMQKRMLAAVENLPGVAAAAYAGRIPLNLGWSQNTVFKDSTTDYRISNAAAHPLEYAVSPGYFHAAGTTLLQGRAFTWDDKQGAPRVAVVNREFARVLFGSDTNAIDNTFKLGDGTGVRVVGTVEDGKYKTLSEEPQPAMFLPMLQSPSSWTWMIVRANHNAQDLAPVLEQTLRSLDEGLPLTINTWDKELGTALLPARAASIALGVLGGLGAMLSITGIFGMAAYSVSKRLRELGIRVALGAQRKEVLMAALGRAFKLLTFGSAAGLLLGILASRVLAFIVYQATPRDPLVLSGVVVSMALLGLVATWIPARRAMSIDPVILLREE
jgi:predicted permease